MQSLLFSHFDARHRLKRRSRFVKCDVPVRPDPTQKELDPAELLDALLVVAALG
jgi:hypothetical protein